MVYARPNALTVYIQMHACFAIKESNGVYVRYANETPSFDNLGTHMTVSNMFTNSI